MPLCLCVRFFHPTPLLTLSLCSLCLSGNWETSIIGQLLIYYNHARTNGNCASGDGAGRCPTAGGCFHEDGWGRDSPDQEVGVCSAPVHEKSLVRMESRRLDGSTGTRGSNGNGREFLGSSKCRWDCPSATWTITVVPSRKDHVRVVSGRDNLKRQKCISSWEETTIG